jgi:charged multivesicular body protein 3
VLRVDFKFQRAIQNQPWQEMDDIAEAEVEKILFEVTKGQLGEGAAISTPLVQEEETAGPADVSSEEEEDDLQSRLAALRS